MLKDKNISIPIYFFYSYYDGEKYPGSKKFKKLKDGANCQSFVYELLKYFGYFLPDFRSSNLWEDKVYTKVAKKMQPLDILFFNKTKDPFGAHLGLYLGNNKVVHLSKEVGYPTIWDFSEFRERSKYKKLVGAKRALKAR